MGYRIELADARVAGSLDAARRGSCWDGPYGPGQAFLLHAEGAGGAGGELIGTAGLEVRAVRLGDRTLRAARFAELAVAQAHRGGLPALALARAVRRHVDESFDLGYGFPNVWAPIYRRAGYLPLGEVRRFTRVLRTGPILARRLAGVPIASLLARGVGALIDRAGAAATHARARGTLRRFALAWLDAFDLRFDQLWRESVHLAPISSERTAALLAWRFGQRPGHRHRVAALLERGSGRLRAYCVLCDAAPALEIADLFGATFSDVDLLLRCLLPALHERGVAAVSFRFLGAPRLARVLDSHGFTRRPEARAAVLAVGARLADARAVTDPTAWYLTDLDAGA